MNLHCQNQFKIISNPTPTRFQPHISRTGFYSKIPNGNFPTIKCTLEALKPNSVSTAEAPSNFTMKGILALLMATVDGKSDRRVISLGYGDPTAHSCFQPTLVAEQALVDNIHSRNLNGYAPTAGLPQTRRAIAKYLSTSLPYKLSSDDVYVTAGCTQSIEVALSLLAQPGANILVPKPGFPLYELCASFRNLEVRHFNLQPQNKWEVDLNAVESLVDKNTVAMVIINPGNPCGSVYSYHHLKKIAEAAARHNILVIADEVYGHLAFGGNPFVPMGVFGSIAPVLTLGSLSKRWLVPGWRIGWFVTSDPNGIFKSPKVVGRLMKYLDIGGSPATMIQAAVPQILEQTEKAFFENTLSILKRTSTTCVKWLKEIPCISCPHEPEGSMAFMVKLNLHELKDIKDDVDFCFKLAKEESVIILPGVVVGLKNWIRITFAVEPSSLEEALERVKSFCMRHSSQLENYN